MKIKKNLLKPIVIFLLCFTQIILILANTIPTHNNPKLNSTDSLNRTTGSLTGFNQSASDIDDVILIITEVK